MHVYRSKRVRLPEFMWQALGTIAEYANERAIPDPKERIDVSGLIQVILLAALRHETLEAIAEASPDFQEAITAWVELQIERDPRAEAIFSLPLWTFARRAN